MTASFFDSSTMRVFRAKSFVIGHLRLAWLILSRHRREEAETIAAREIRRFAVANGAANRYHDTLTRFWIQLVGHVMENAPEAGSVDEMLARFPLLLEKNLPYRHWRERLSTQTKLVQAGSSQILFHYPEANASSMLDDCFRF